MPRIFLIGLLFELSLVPLALFLGWWWQEPPLATLEPHWQAAGVGTVAAVPMLALFAAGHRWAVGPLRRIWRILEETLGPSLRQCNVLEIAVFALTAGLGEEMLFRGVLQPALGKALEPLVGHAYEPAAGLVAASVLFGLAHFVTPTYAVLATLIGFVLGGLFLASGNLLVPVTTHGVYDLVALVYLLHVGPGSAGRQGAAHDAETDPPSAETNEGTVEHEQPRETH